MKRIKVEGDSFFLLERRRSRERRSCGAAGVGHGCRVRSRKARAQRRRLDEPIEGFRSLLPKALVIII